MQMSIMFDDLPNQNCLKKVYSKQEFPKIHFNMLSSTFSHSGHNKIFLVFGIFSWVSIHTFGVWAIFRTCSIGSYLIIFSVGCLNKVDLRCRRGKEICTLPIWKQIKRYWNQNQQINIIWWFFGYFCLKIVLIWRRSNWKRDNIEQEGAGSYSESLKPTSHLN